MVRNGSIFVTSFIDDPYIKKNNFVSTKQKHRDKTKLRGLVPAGGLGAEKVGGWFLRPAGTLLDRDLTELPDLT